MPSRKSRGFAGSLPDAPVAEATMSDNADQFAEDVRMAQGEPERHGLVKHIRQHGRATPMHVWVNQCRWCHLGLRWTKLRHPSWFKVPTHTGRYGGEHGSSR